MKNQKTDTNGHDKAVTLDELEWWKVYGQLLEFDARIQQTMAKAQAEINSIQKQREDDLLAPLRQKYGFREGQPLTLDRATLSVKA